MPRAASDEDDWRVAAAAEFSAQRSVGQVCRELKKQIRADRICHLQSIDLDAAFVAEARDSLGAPATFANLRCGVWYVPPELRTGTCYFKSTDGHTGNWGFSLSRLNLQVALAAAHEGRVLIVDSTRSGKRFPDSLSKTVPIWCAVINRALAEDREGGSWDTALHLPPWVPPSERAQIEARLAVWVDALRRPALRPPLEQLRESLRYAAFIHPTAGNQQPSRLLRGVPPALCASQFASSPVLGLPAPEGRLASARGARAARGRRVAQRRVLLRLANVWRGARAAAAFVALCAGRR